MAEPSFAETLSHVAELPYRRIVVQPHLLFSGELLADIGAKVAEMARLPADATVDRYRAPRRRTTSSESPR